MARKPLKNSQGATMERLRHGQAIIEPSAFTMRGEVVQVRQRILNTHPIESLYVKGHIDRAQMEAGMRFHAIFFAAGKYPHTASAFDERIQKSRTGHTAGIEEYTQAQQEYNAALSVLSSSEADVMFEVAGMANPVRSEESGGRKRMLSLQTGLRALAVFWGIKAC